MKITDATTIYQLTNHRYRAIDQWAIDVPTDVIQEIMQLIKKIGCDTTNTDIVRNGTAFQKVIKNVQKTAGMPQTGILDDTLLHYIYQKSQELDSDEIEDDSTEENENYWDETLVGNPHYDPYFINNSSKDARRNHKDIIIAFGDGSNRKIIKDVFMRSESVQVDTSGNPISEVYTFVARDVKESDAEEDQNKYIGDTEKANASSDIKYEYEGLFNDNVIK